MNYPIQGLAIIGPILFLVLLVITPIIGVFGGWKRAAYWGGGNLVVYFIGLISFKTSSGKIYGLIEPLIIKLLGSKVPTSDLKPLAESLVAPVFFLALVIAANILLFICYYAFAKRLMRIGKFSPTKRVMRLETKIKKAKLAHKSKESIAQLIVKKNKWEAVVAKKVNSVGNRVWFNRTIGGIGMTILCLPTIFTSAQVIMMATTSKTTRTNKFVTGVYDFLNKTGKTFNWMAYYDSTKTPKDFDALFGLLGAINKKVNIGGTEKPLTDALTDTFKGIGDMVQINSTTSPEKQEESIKETLASVATQWNSIMDQAGTEMSALFQSENVTKAAESLISSFGIETTTVDASTVEKAFGEGSTFANIVEEYTKAANGEESTVIPSSSVLKAIPTSQECVNNLTNSVKNIIKISDGATEAQTKLFNDSIAKLMNMILYVG